LARSVRRLAVEWLECRLAPANVSVYSFHNDPSLTGENLQETILNPSDVNPTNFGKLASVPTDGYAYANPLYVANLMISGTPHNVAFVATEHDSLYAYDIGSSTTSPTGIGVTQLWQRSFINPSAGITSVPNGDVGTGDIVPEIGITGSPVIDPATNTLYVVAKTKEMRTDGVHYVQTLYAIDITSPTGANMTTPYVIGDSHGSGSGAQGYNNQTTVIQVPGAGPDNSGGANPMIKFDAFVENQRPSLQLLNGRVYVAWASHGDNGPYHGWVVGFNESTLQPEKVFNTSPNCRANGIWQSEGALSTDGRYLYFSTGNGFGPDQGSGPYYGFDPAHGNYGESVVKLDTMGSAMMMPVADYFTPNEWLALDHSDADLGSGGVMLLPDSVGSAAHQQLMVETGKTGKIYLIDRNNMGQNVPAGQADRNVQTVTAGPNGVWGNPAFYQESANSGLVVYHGSGADTREFRVTNGLFTPASATYHSGQSFGFPGAQPIISGNGMDNTTAISWEIQVDNYGTQGHATLHAYAARPAAQTGTLTELYNSNMVGIRDQLSVSNKFTSATESNGWVFAAQAGGFFVFGLFPTHTAPSAPPTALAGMGVSPTSIQINWTNPNPNTATGIKIFRSAGDDQHYTQINTVMAAMTSYTDTGLTQGQVYFYKIAATNQAGDSAFTPEVQLTTLIAAPVLTAANVTSVRVALSWTRPPVANDHYSVERSTTPDFAMFTTVASNIPGSQLTYDDTDPILVSQPGRYFYRVRGFTNPGETAFGLSNFVAVVVGPASGQIDYGEGFPVSTFDLQGNGSAQIGAESTLRLTPGNVPPYNQAGSAFSLTQRNILSFDTQFGVRLHEGTQPLYANGFAFVIQAVSPGALGQSARGLGYQGIPNSVAVTFNTWSHAPENGTGGSVGLFFNGDLPTTPQQAGEVVVPLDATEVNLESQSAKTIDISYDYDPANPSMSVLNVHLVDADHVLTPFDMDFHIDIPSKLGNPVNGNTTGYVGLTGATGSENYWELEDITSWTFTPNGPAAPHALTVSSGSDFNNLAWTATSADEEGYYVERSTSQTTGFTRIATLAAGVTTYHDDNNGGGLPNPQSYFYRVQAFNHSGADEQDSGYSNVATGAVVPIPFSNGFPNSTGFVFQGTGVTPPVTVFPGNPAVMRLTDGRGNEATSSWYTVPVGSGMFNTTFTLKDVPHDGSADSVSFVIQNDPRGTAALGTGGGDGGYASITHSIALKFDLYTHGSHNPSTGLFFNGASPAGNPAQDVPLTGINLGSGDPMQITVTYDGALTIMETVRDTVTSAVFTHTYTLTQTLAQYLGGNQGLVGFTGGTGGEDATMDIVNWTGSFSLAPAALNHFTVSAPTTSTAGAPFSVTVTAFDQYSNIFTGYTGTIHFTSNDSQATLPADYQFTAADAGVHTFTNGVILNTAGVQTVRASAGAATGSANVTVNAAALDHFVVTTSVTTTTAGAAFSATVTAKDAFNNTVTSYGGTIHFASSDTGASTVLPADYLFVPGDNGVHTFAGGVTLTTAGVQSVQVADGAATGTVSVSVSAAGLDHFGVVTAVASTTAGTPFDVTVTAQDVYNNTVTTYTGTVHFTSADTGATLPPDYTFQPTDDGSITFSGGVTLVTAGTQDVTVTDTGTSQTGTTNVAVSPAAADHLVFSQQPTDTPANGTITPPVLVAVVDVFGNVITSDNTDTVTVSIGVNPSGGTLNGTLTITVVNGVATFSDLSIDTSGSGYTLHATNGGSVTDADSNTFNIL
jgi:hypothetical protein